MFRIALTCFLVTTSMVILAGTPYVAQGNQMSTFENFPSNVWQPASTVPLGTIYILKSDVKATSISWDPSTVNDKLYYLASSAFSIGKRAGAGMNFSLVDEKSALNRNQCVAFGKFMTGAGYTGDWVKSTPLTDLYPNGKAASQFEAVGKIPYGTMIAYFDMQAKYPNNQNSHVVIVRGVNADSTGKILSIDVYGQNGVDSAVIGSITVPLGDNKTYNPTGGTIVKYTIPWNNTKSTRGSFSAMNYNIVTN